MDEKTRRGRVDGADGGETERAREKEGYTEANRDERGTAGQGTANVGPEGSRTRQLRGAANERQEAAATNRASEPRRSGMESSRENGAELRRVERVVGCGGDVAPVVFYLLKTSSELGAGRIPQLES